MVSLTYTYTVVNYVLTRSKICSFSSSLRWALLTEQPLKKCIVISSFPLLCYIFTEDDEDGEEDDEDDEDYDASKGK